MVAVKVKICGITNLEDALAAVDAGCDAVGFVFYKKSPRFIRPKAAQEIISRLPKTIIKAGVFVNSKEKTIKRIAEACGLDMLQFHGNESPQFCERFRNYKVIKAFRVKDSLELESVLRYKTFAYLFDTYVRSKIGGTGRIFNWGLLDSIGGIKRAIFLSGGLTKENVRAAIDKVCPGWVDVSSSVETSFGKKNHRKIKEFIKSAKGE